jgi:hypothetical protein
VTEPAPPIFPPGRYGRRRRPRRTPRWLPAALAVPVVLGTLWLAVHLYQRYGADPYRPSVTGFSQVGEDRLRVAVRVRKPAAPATCRLRARDRSGAEIGYAEVPVPAGTDVTGEYSLDTRGRAVAVDLLGCRATPR